MPSAPRNLKQRARAQTQVELILLLARAGRGGLPVSEVLKNESFQQYAGYDGEPHKELDRLTDALAPAGYEIERFEWESLYGAKEWRLRLTQKPFVPIPVTGEELPEVLRLVSTYLASNAAYNGGIPDEILLAREARANSRMITAQSASKTFSMFPLGERLLTDGRWEIVGLLTDRATVIASRVGGRYSFSLGDECADMPTTAADAQDLGTPLSWGPGQQFDVAFEVPDGAIGSVVASFGSAITQTTDIGSGWERFVVSGVNRAELYRQFALLRGNIRNIHPPVFSAGYDTFLDGLLAISPVSEGFTQGPRILDGKKPIPATADPAADHPLHSERGHGGTSATGLIQRLVLVLRHLDLHGSATLAQLSEVTGLPSPQAVQLVECFRAAYGHVFDDGGISFVMDGDQLVGITETAPTPLLKSTGRYYVTQGQMLGAAAAALIELEKGDPETHRRNLLEKIVERAEEALAVDVDVPTDRPVASPGTHRLVAYNIGRVITVTYTNPWSVTTRTRAIVPLHKPRQLGGRWMVDAVDAAALAGNSQPTIKHFYLDFMEDASTVGEELPIPFSEQDIEASVKVSGRIQAALRVKKGAQLDWLTAGWGARSIEQSGHESPDEVSVAVEVYPPAHERLLDLYIRSDGQIRVDLPVRLRQDAHERIARFRSPT